MVEADRTPDVPFNPAERSVADIIKSVAGMAVNAATVVAAIYYFEELTKPIRNRNV